MSFEKDEFLPLDIQRAGRRPIWVPGDDRLAVVHSDAYGQWAFSAAHPTQGRRFVNAVSRLGSLAESSDVSVIDIEASALPTFAEMALVHDMAYVEQVVLDGRCGEWAGVRRDLGALALRMAGGTLLALRALLDGVAHTAVNFAGAKHHAMRDHSSGFCVFNDFAVAAKIALDGDARVFEPFTMRWKPVERITIIDLDAHHGDGTERLLAEDLRVQTISIHDGTIFPGTGHDDDEGRHIFNMPLAAGSGDLQLDDAVTMAIGFAQRFDPDLVFIAMGADGHAADPLSTLEYSTEGMVDAVRSIRRAFRETPILLGGAGGYRPDDITPEVWAQMALAAATPVDQSDRVWVDFSDAMDYCQHEDFDEFGELEDEESS